MFQSGIIDKSHYKIVIYSTFSFTFTHTHLNDTADQISILAFVKRLVNDRNLHKNLTYCTKSTNQLTNFGVRITFHMTQSAVHGKKLVVARDCYTFLLADEDHLQTRPVKFMFTLLVIDIRTISTSQQKPS